MASETDAGGVLTDPTRLGLLLGAVGGFGTLVVSWFRGRRDDNAKSEVTMVEQYKTLVAGMTKTAEEEKAERVAERAADKAEFAAEKAAFAAEKLKTARLIVELKAAIDGLVSQVHYLRLHLAQNGIKMPPKWNPDDDSALFPTLRSATEEAT